MLGPFGWFSIIETSMYRNGLRLARSPRSSATRWRRCGFECGRPCGRRAGHRLGGGSTDARFGRRSRLGARAKTPRWMPGYRLPWEPGGSERPAACHHRILRPRRSRRRGDTFPSPSVRRSRFCASRAMACVRSPTGSGGRLPHSRANCGATRPRLRVPGHDRAVACRPRRPSSEAGEAGH